MTNRHHGQAAVLAIAAVTLLEGAAYAQFNGGTERSNVAGRTALENASGGGAAGRSPGNLVTSGVARAQSAIVSPRFGFSITETSRPTSPRAQFLAQAIQIVFADLNDAIFLLRNVLLARAGLPPALPGGSVTVPGLTSGTGTATSTGGTGSTVASPSTAGAGSTDGTADTGGTGSTDGTTSTSGGNGSPGTPETPLGGSGSGSADGPGASPDAGTSRPGTGRRKRLLH